MANIGIKHTQSVWRGAPCELDDAAENDTMHQSNGSKEQKMVKFTNPRSSAFCVSHLHI